MQVAAGLHARARARLHYFGVALHGEWYVGKGSLTYMIFVVGNYRHTVGIRVCEIVVL